MKARPQKDCVSNTKYNYDGLRDDDKSWFDLSATPSWSSSSASLTSSWLSLPREIVTLIFYHLTSSDLAAVAQTCKRWHDISKEDKIWKARFLADFGTRKGGVSKKRRKLPKKGEWREAYHRIITEHYNQLAREREADPERHAKDVGQYVAVECNICHKSHQQWKPDEIQPIVNITPTAAPRRRINNHSRPARAKSGYASVPRTTRLVNPPKPEK